MQIRQATVEDASAISNLIQPLARKYIAPDFPPEGARKLLACMEPGAIEENLQAGFEYYVAEEDGALAGVAAVRDNTHLYHLFVAEPFQGQGLARRLWHFARDACCKAGNPGQFTVNSSKYAVPMYQKFGFVESGPPQTTEGVTCIPMRLSFEHPPN
jgi:GNAT superfamily N-acetyltransferase